MNLIEVYLDRHTETQIGKPNNSEYPYAIWNHHEELKIDRATEIVEHYRQIFEQCDVRNIWHIEGGVSNFLDGIDLDALSEAEGNPSDVYVDPRRYDSYKIKVTTKLSGIRKITGTLAPLYPGWVNYSGFFMLEWMGASSPFLPSSLHFAALSALPASVHLAGTCCSEVLSDLNTADRSRQTCCSDCGSLLPVRSVT